MTPDPSAPPVVAVVVTHDPGDWFEATLRGLAEQDYPNLSVLVVDAASAVDPTPRVAEVLPRAFVRRLATNPGFGAAANEVLEVVEGAAFHLFCHDDVRLEAGVVRILVEEALRSNAGVVGPKVVSWDRSDVLLQVGMSADKAGVPAELAERGELDQEQHDRVRDVFFVPGGCTLVRADLFAEVGGFDPAIELLGEDLDLCWRAQLVGGRVLVVPDARVAHVEALPTRRPVDDRRRLQARHRLRTVVKCYGFFHLLRILPQVALVALAEAAYAIVAGQPGQARDVGAAWLWNLRSRRDLLEARRRVQRARRTRDAEVRRLQVHGSARLTGFLRGQLGGQDRVNRLGALARDTFAGVREPVRRRVMVVWAVVLAVFLVGSRGLLLDGVPAVGSLAPFPDSAFRFLDAWVSGWRSIGLGVEAPAPTAFGLLGVGGLLSGGSTALLRTLLVVGAVPVGYLGMWRLTRPLGDRAVRLVGLVVYAAVPLPYGALAHGSWGGLVLYATAPWLVGALVRATRLEPFGDERSPARRAVGLGVLLGLVTAFVPVAAVVVLAAAVALVAGSLLAGGTRVALRAPALVLGASLVAAVLHVPWVLDWALPDSGWHALGGVAPLERTAVPFTEVLRLETGPLDHDLLGWAPLVAAALPLLVGRSWRHAWAVRLWAVASALWLLAWAGGRGWLGVDVPPVEVVLAPVGVALALSAALGLAAFRADLPGYRFGWRQVASLVAAAAVAVAILPIAAAGVSGRWEGPDRDFPGLLSWMREDPSEGSFRVLWVGRAGVLPLGSWELGPGVSYGISEGGAPDATDLWPGGGSATTALVGDALEVAMDGGTSRLGRLYAPMGIRYIVLAARGAPELEGLPHRPLPEGLTRVLADQVDLRRLDVDPALAVYENTAWVPTRAALPSGALDGAGGVADAVAVPLESARPALLDQRAPSTFAGVVRDGSEVYVAEASSDRWRLEANGAAVPRSSAFGWANRFSVEHGGPATLSYQTSFPHLGLIALQAVVWAVLMTAVVLGRLQQRVGVR